MKKILLAVMVSGRGSNLQSIIDNIESGRLDAQIACVISDAESAAALERARKHGIEALFLDPEGKKREDYFAEITRELRKRNVELIVMAGFMRIVPASFFKEFENKIINIHPALLPSFRGLRAQKQALEAGAKIAGCTVHFATPEVDAGPIIQQKAVEVREGDSEESLSARILEQEHKILPKAIQLIAENRVKIDGKKIADEVKKNIAKQIEGWKKKPGLATVLVGDNPALKVYVSRKNVTCKEYGFHSKEVTLPESVEQDELIKKIWELNEDNKIHGILVQLPLPSHIDENAVVVGRSNLVGKPTAVLLLNEGCTLTVCHSKTLNLAEETKKADVLVVAVGKPKLITGEMVKEGAIVIDVGITKNAEGKILGDVDFETVKEKASFITPVPGGVGPMTIAMLLQNTFEAAKMIEGLQ